MTILWLAILGALLLMDEVIGLSTIRRVEDMIGSNGTTTSSVRSRPSNSHTSISKILPPLPKGYQARLYLVRHAETDWNAEGRIQGCSNDIELNDAGRKQAFDMARKHFADLPIDLIVSSHLKRSISTADIIRQNIKQQQQQRQDMVVDDGSFFKCNSNTNSLHKIIDGFEEMNFGKLEGITYKRIPTKRKEMWKLFRAAIHVTKTHFIQPQQGANGIVGGGKTERWPGGGESINDVETRTRYGLKHILSLNNNPSTRDDQQHIVVVGHKQTNKILLASLLWKNALQCEQIRQQNSCINVIDLDSRGRWHARLINYTD